MHGASFLGVYVCVRAHAHTHICTVHRWRSENGSQESFLSYHVGSRIQLRWPVLLLCLYPPSRLVGPSPFFCQLCFGCHGRPQFVLFCFFMCVSVCTCLCGCMHVWIGVFACVWVCACMDRCVCTCVGVCMQKSEGIEVSVRHLSFSIALHLSFETEYQ